MARGYTVYIESSAAGAVQQLQRGDQVDVCKRIGALADQPRPPGCVRDAAPSNVYRVRATRFSVAYIVDDAARAVTVTRIGDRKDIFG